jgi:tRNA threonylcarbamoyladenosine biosynthesis protein TsaE
VRVLARSESDTEALGARLAGTRPPRDELAVLFLEGELGAGKTTLARGLLRALGVAGPVRSPTYTLVELYPLEGLTAVHADLYRLRAPQQLEDLGLREWAGPNHLWLIEWPERGTGHLPAPDLRVALTVRPGAHHIEVTPASRRGAQWVGRLGGGGSPGAPGMP